MPPATANPTRKPLSWLLRLGIGLVLAFVFLIFFEGLEMAISLNAPRFGAPSPGSGPDLIYWSLRAGAYLLLAALAAWAIYWLKAPPRRHYWIALGIATVILGSPAGIALYNVGFMLLIVIFSIPMWV